MKILDYKLKHYHYFVPMCRKGYVYKYMDLESAIISLQNSTIRFVEPTKWKDPYESRFYKADFSKVAPDGSYPKQFYACCCTKNRASEAAWNTYSYNSDGMKGRCIQFVIDLKKLRECLSTFCSTNNYEIYEGVVNYSLPDEEIENLHYLGHKHYSTYFNKIDLQSYLSLMLIKRPAFYYEEELRFFIIPNDEEVKDAIFPTIQWKDIIKEIIVDVRFSDIEMDILKDYCQKAGICISDSDIGIRLYKCRLYEKSNTHITIGTKKSSRK